MECENVSFVVHDDGKISAYYNAGTSAIIGDNCVIKTSTSFIPFETYMANHVEYSGDVTVYRYILKVNSEDYFYVMLEYINNNIVNFYLIKNPFYFIANTDGIDLNFSFQSAIDLEVLSNRILNYGYVIDVLKDLIDSKDYDFLCQIAGHVVK